jgi:hypothetical protein
MSLLTGNIAVNPAIKGNLRGLKAVSVEVQTELLQLPTLYGKLDPAKLQEQFEARIKQAGLRVNDDEAATLVVSLAADVRHIPYLGGAAALYAVDTTLRELLPLPRAGDDPDNSNEGRLVDTWRQKESTGILLPKTSLNQAAALLTGECRRLVDGFLTAWQTDEPTGARKKPTEPPEVDPPPPPADPLLQKLRQELERILGRLAQGNDGSASIEKFEVNGTKVAFKARIRHRQVVEFLGKKTILYSVTTHADGAFDAADPSSFDGKVCVDKPQWAGGGEICASLSELKGALGG